MSWPPFFSSVPNVHIDAWPLGPFDDILWIQNTPFTPQKGSKAPTGPWCCSTKPGCIWVLCFSDLSSHKRVYWNITQLISNYRHIFQSLPQLRDSSPFPDNKKKKKKRWDFRALALPSLAQTPSGTVAHVGLFNPHTDKTLHAGEEWGWKKKKKNSGAEKVTTFYLRKKIIYNCMRTLNKTGIYYVVKMVLI